ASTTTCSTSGLTAPTGDPHPPTQTFGNPWAVSSTAPPPRYPGVSAGSTSSASASTIPCSTSGGTPPGRLQTAPTGDPHKPIGNRSATPSSSIVLPPRYLGLPTASTSSASASASTKTGSPQPPRIPCSTS